MILDLFNGPANSVGLTTSGGTESILIAMLSYREWGRKRGITHPNVIAPSTAHAAFDKACFYFGMELRKVPLTPAFRPDIAKMRSLIDGNTVCLVGSCPDFAFGICDPIQEIAAIAREQGINCHSDCSLGSFLLPFAESAGFKLPCDFDFRVEGVTSISCDPHKFGMGPKGHSVVLFRTAELRRLSFFTLTEWPGGIYVTPTLAGSRSGAVIAGSWAALMKQGKEGFIEKAKIILTAAKKIRVDIANITGARLISNDPTCVVSFQIEHINAAALNEQMAKRHKWFLHTV